MTFLIFLFLLFLLIILFFGFNNLFRYFLHTCYLFWSLSKSSIGILIIAFILSFYLSYLNFIALFLGNIVILNFFYLRKQTVWFFLCNVYFITNITIIMIIRFFNLFRLVFVLLFLFLSFVCVFWVSPTFWFFVGLRATVFRIFWHTCNRYHILIVNLLKFFVTNF